MRLHVLPEAVVVLVEGELVVHLAGDQGEEEGGPVDQQCHSTRLQGHTLTEVGQAEFGDVIPKIKLDLSWKKLDVIFSFNYVCLFLRLVGAKSCITVSFQFYSLCNTDLSQTETVQMTVRR